MAQPTPLMGARDGARPFAHTHMPAEHAVLIQSRETGDVVPGDDAARGQIKALPFAKSWVHLFAGAYVHAPAAAARRRPWAAGPTLTEAAGSAA